ncbi:HNH endonuclease [Salinisphaera hydrothermalis]|uniref:HNH endonuclease n=1 Tax=Salinisphaera hydrothermalis TaxID=563188 RepID=UPI003342D7A8
MGNHGQKGVNQHERAYRAWTVLTEAARGGRTLTYGGLAAELGMHHRPLGYVLEPIQKHCFSENIPPLTGLVVDRFGVPGRGFIGADRDHFREAQERVWAYDWQSIDNPFAFASDGTSFIEVVDTLAMDPDQAEPIYRMVKSRGMQQMLFRAAVLQAYGYECAFTGLSFVEVLDACHIVPWSHASEGQRLDVRNGLPLNSTHHRLFDTGYITLTPEYRIIYADPRREDGPYSPADLRMSVDLHRKAVRLPVNERLHPDPACIAYRNKLMGWKA